jgi:hypothetical protein
MNKVAEIVVIFCGPGCPFFRPLIHEVICSEAGDATIQTWPSPPNPIGYFPEICPLADQEGE